MPRIDGIFLSPSQEVIVNRIAQCKAVCISNSMEEKIMIRQQEKEMTKLQADVRDLKSDIEEFKENMREMVKMFTLIGDKNEEDLVNEATIGHLDFVRLSKPSSTATSVTTSTTTTAATASTTIIVTPQPPLPPPQPIPPAPGSYCIPLSRYLRPNLSPSDYGKSTHHVIKPLSVNE